MAISAGSDPAAVMFSLQSGKYPGSRLGRRGLAACVAVLLAAAPWRGLSADASAPPPPAAPIEAITDLGQMWPLSPEMRSVAHPLRIEGRVSYFDPGFNNFWLEQNGIGTYLHLSSSPPALRTGQHVIIDGTLVPDKGLSADAVTVRVLQEYEPVVPLDTKGRIREFDVFDRHIVTADAYVDEQLFVDVDHVRLTLIVDNRPVIGWVKPDDPRSIPQWQGSFVRMVGLYSGRFDPTKTESTIELWISRQEDVKVVGSLAGYSGFGLPPTPINEIYRKPLAEEIHIRGRIQTQDLGSSMVIRDDTGQVIVRSVQQQRFPFGAEVDAVGRVAVSGAQWVLEPALCREVSSPVQGSRSARRSPPLIANVGQIRSLTAEEAARGLPVTISGTVTWAHPGEDYFYLQDINDGVRVNIPRGRMELPALLKYLTIEGVTAGGTFAPVVEVRRYEDLGAMSPPPARSITFEQAIMGTENGQWIEMRGFLRSTESNGDWRRIFVTTPSGEFIGRMNSPVPFVANPGSLIRVKGVCSATVGADGQLPVVMLLVPFLHNITIDEDAPVDAYDLPLRPMNELERLSAGQDLMRVRVSGVVLKAVPGQLIYLQDERAGLLLFSRATVPLAPGDSIEAVGILGREGVRTVLREAVYHKLASGALPVPQRLSDPSHFASALDGRLVGVRGTLIDVLRQPEHTRLTVQSGNTLFEAALDHPRDATAPSGLALGTLLEIAGIYRADFDSTRRLRGFQLQLRSWGDVAVLHGPRLWTVQRALTAAAVLGIAALLGVAWVVALRRRVRQQTEQIRGQMERQARLEADVQRAARLESLGVLAGGIAHDFNNLLTVVIGNLSLAMFDAKIAGSAGGFLREIERAAYRARDLTQQLLTFARGGNPVRTNVALPETVREAAGSMLHGSNVRCEYEVSPGLWSADVDKDQITQTIQNLTLNAVEAMPNGGVIRISLANEEVAPGAHPALAAGRYVRVAIADTGVGIKPEILARVFDPYFSTKEAGGGLGLATVYSIVKRHGGWIEVESTPGDGAIFTLWLPASDAAKQALPPPVPTAAPAVLSMRAARVLLMDDENGVRRLGETLLLRMGLKPVTVSDGAAAVEVFIAARSAGQPFDLVILDLTIPGGMGGREAMERIRELDPQVPAIVSSGYSNDPVLAEFARYGFQAVVPKPYEVSQLAETVKRLLAQRQ
jgi:signal transduction histidine kinase/CheY-like chemotaxis protein